MARGNPSRAPAFQIIWIVATVFLLTLCKGSRAWDIHDACGDKRCASSPHLVGACFTFHGTLRPYNGNPTYRIWRAGTKRMVGVLCDEDPIVPANLKSALQEDLNASWERDFSGDYEVCPFTQAKPGRMQFVCVEKVSKLVVYDRQLKRVVVDERPPVSRLAAPH
jgi:hypothetical protein